MIAQVIAPLMARLCAAVAGLALGGGLTLRGLWERRWLSLLVLVVATVPVASAAAGPIFADAASTALGRGAVQDGAAVERRGWRLTSEGGQVAGSAAELAASAPFLLPPIDGMEIVGPESESLRSHLLIWQDGQCDHVVLIRGRCPAAGREIMVSEASGFRLGSTVRLNVLTEVPRTGGDRPRLARLRVVGVYRPGRADDPFWFGRVMFPQTAGFGQDRGDPLFTVPETARETRTPGNVPWTATAIVLIDPARFTAGGVAALEAAHALTQRLGPENLLVFSQIPDLLAELRAQGDGMGVPTLLVIAQLVALGWLLLYLTVRDLVTARGPEIALARLRGHGRLGVWRFGLAEPLVLLAAAFAAGLALAVRAAQFVADRMLPQAQAVTLTADAVLAGAAVPLGGVVAAAVAARAMAVRPITEEWRRTPRGRARGWVTDAIVLAVTGIGLFELLDGGVITQASGQRASSLAVPGLLAVAVALLACRAVPFLARRLFGLTRRAGGVGAFLALRQIARGPATAGSLIVLATAFGMASFAAAASATVSGNFERVARAHNGADSVLTINAESVGGAAGLAEAVARADPTGRGAAPVLVVPGPPKMIAMDPERFAHVANWDPAWAAAPLAELTAKLRVGAAPRIRFSGDRIRLRLRPVEVPENWRARLFLDLRVPGAPKGASLPLGAPDRRVAEWPLPRGCHTAPCELRAIRGDVSIFAPGEPASDNVRLDILATRVEVRNQGRWRVLDAGFTDPGRWRGTAEAGERGLTLSMAAYGGLRAEPATYPDPLPVLANGPLVKNFSPGLDQAYLVKGRPVAVTAALPGHDEVGTVVDLESADRVALSIDPRVSFQVWVAPGHLEAVRKGLAAQGIRTPEPRRVADLVAGYRTQAPGLALMLLLPATLAAAALALGRAVLALYTAARRRRYELSALGAAGARTSALRVALLLEQLITLVAGTVAGMLAGVVAARLALPYIPEFVRQPVTPPLIYEPALAPLAAVIGAALLAALLAATVTAEILLRGIRVERLRQAPA
ncbi:FtsX-like permease family protein [Thermopolyspora sp. NPDC052614]|uniref:FtsX-like permease family protein n=1 Tax=Thermopolyspora sp. NPDC052614 TaxID=3155682 RepID=UPI0034365C59